MNEKQIVIEMFKWFILWMLILTIDLRSQPLFRQPDYAEVNLFIHTIGIPDAGLHFSSPVKGRVGISLNSGWHLKVKDKTATTYQLSFRYYHQRDLHYALNLHHEFIKSFNIGERIMGFGGAGGGYLHLFEDAPLYQFKRGEYSKKKDFGRPKFLISLSIGLAIRISKSSPYSITINQQVLGQFPFAVKSGLPLLFQNHTGIGVRRSFKTNTKS